MYIPDNYDIWEANERRLEQIIELLPICEECGNPIQQEDAVYIGGAWYCDDCLNENRKDIEI